MSGYDSMSLAELKEAAKSKGLKGVSTLKKAELAEVLKKADMEQTDSEPEKVAAAKAVTVEKEAAEKQDMVREPGNGSYYSEGARTVRRSDDREQPQDRRREQAPYERRQQFTRNTGAGVQSRMGYQSRQQDGQQRAQYDNQGRSQYDNQNRQQYDNQGRSQYDNQNRPQNENFSRQQADNQIKEYQARVQKTPEELQEELDKLIKYPGKSMPEEVEKLDSHITKEGILEIMQDGYGFIRCDNFLPGEADVFVSPYMIKRLNLKTGDIISGNIKVRMPTEKFTPLLYVHTINGFPATDVLKRPKFDTLTPIYPDSRIRLETPGCEVSLRMIDILSPIGKGQRGMIVSPPKAGKTTLLKQVAKAITTNHPDMTLLILLVDERPEEVTDIKESIQGKNVNVIYSTFDELPENHKRVSEMVIEHAKRLVEHGKDVVILLDSITRLARANNQLVNSSGRTLSGGLDPAALYMPKKFFGAARNMREGGSLTVLATALVDTGSRMDDVVFEEFKGTGNMELVLDRNLSEKRIFPAIDLPKSGTRKEELLLTPEEKEVNSGMRRMLNNAKNENAAEILINEMSKTRNNKEFIGEFMKKYRNQFQ